MTFPRIKAAGWTINEKLSSAQMTQLDIDHANSLDKTGDTTTGVIHVGSGSRLYLDNGGDGYINSIVSVGSTGKVTTAGTGTIELGNNDFPKLSTTHTGRARTITTPLNGFQSSSHGTFNFASDSTYIVGDATSSSAMYGIVPRSMLHIGATLSSVDVLFVVSSSHVALPFNTASMSVFSLPLTVGSTVPASLALSTSAVQYFPLPATYTDYIDSSKLQTMTFTCNQNNVVAENTTYFVNIYDEYGAGSAAGNKFYALRFNYTNITDMRFA